MDEHLGKDIPKLGFGLMRLPRKNNMIDIEQTKEMTDLFLERGFTYFDTAYMYDGSEEAARQALVDRHPRNSYLIASKLPAWSAKSQKDAEQMFYTSLERTGVDYFDYFLLHNLGEKRTSAFEEYNIWEFLQERKEEGLISHLGFSIHDKSAVLDQILTVHPEMEFVQIQLNYADWENPVLESRKCYEIALKHGKPVIAMEPIKGGNLVSLPSDAERNFRQIKPDASMVSWAVRFAASLEGIITVLSGMSNLDQMRENTAFMKAFEPLSPKEFEAIEKAREAILLIPSVPCTACDYCMSSCPQTIAIPGIFEAQNMYLRYKNIGSAKSRYNWNTAGQQLQGASSCISCHACEDVCPQHIAISEEMEKAAAVFEA